MNHRSEQRGFALITVLGILALFLLVSILLLTMTSQNSQNFGNAYQKQRYYNVAEAGIDRGLRDLDSVLPSPGSTGFLSATPPPPPPTPSGNQTPLPNVPNVPYYYSYWYNSSSSGKSTPDPLAGSYGVSSGHTVNVPPNGALIWSYTTTGNRDVAVETVVSRFGTSDTTCALCAGQSVGVTGSDGVTPPPTVCGSSSNPYKICSDPKASPSPAPSYVPIVVGGSYTYGNNCGPSPCAYGDGTNTPNPTLIQQNASPGVLSGFLASQGTIDQLGDARYWQNLATLTSNVKYIDCTSGCSTSQLQAVAPSAGQVTFVKGNIIPTNKTTLSYGGMFIASGCLSIAGQTSMTSAQPTAYTTYSTSAITVVLGTDTQCGGSAASISGGGNVPVGGSCCEPWDGGTLYAAQGSVSISGSGSIKTYSFYGAVIAAGSIFIAGNGFFTWESGLKPQTFASGLFAIDSFAQY